MRLLEIGDRHLGGDLDVLQAHDRLFDRPRRKGGATILGHPKAETNQRPISEGFTPFLNLSNPNSLGANGPTKSTLALAGIVNPVAQ